MFAAGATNPFPRNPMGYGMCGPTIVEWGSAEQKEKYLRRIFTAEDIWCQLFSEPGAGSDVAGLATMAVLDGDEWVLNGQKVWTSLGHRARWGLIICRTDPEAVKHAGITAFVVDMHAPGVDVRPLRQMTGGVGVQRDLLHRRQGAGVGDARSARRGLAGEPHDADERADGDRWLDAATRFGADRLGSRAVAGAARTRRARLPSSTG